MKEFKEFLEEKSTIKPSDAFEREFAYYCYDIICELGHAQNFSPNKSSDKVYFEKLLYIIWYKYLKVFKEYTDLTFWGPHVLEERNKHKIHNVKPLIKLDLQFSSKYDELLFNDSSQSDLDNLIESTFIDRDGQNIISDLEKVYEISNLPEYYSQFYSFHYNITKGNYKAASQFASLPYTRFGVFDNNNAVSWHLGLLAKGMTYPLSNKIFDTHRYADRYKSNWFKENESQIREEFDRQMANYFEKYGDNFIGIILRKFLENLPTIEGKDGVKSYLKQLEEFDIKTDFRKNESFFEIHKNIKNADSINDINFTSEYFKFDIPVKERVRLESTDGFKTPSGLPGFMYYSLMNENIMGFMKKAENKIRSQSGKHKVGERWENETKVFKRLKEKLPDDYKLYREYLIWADGAKRFDCFIENENIAVEYNGEQHYKPIEFFGGESALKRRKASDQLKKEYCKENNIDLFVIKYDEEIEERVDEIISKILS